MPVQTIASVTQENKTFYDRTLLERLLPYLVYLKYGQKKPFNKNQGDTINFRRFNALAVATTPLTEGVVPSGSALSVTAVTATVAQYGDFVTVSDKLDMLGIDPVITETTQLLGEQAGLTLDTVGRDIIVAGTTVQYANNKASRILTAQGDILNGTEIKKAVRTLRRNNAQPLEGKYFIGIVGADVEYDLISDTMWQDVSKYSNPSQIFDGEIGTLYGVRFVRTANVKKFAGLGASACDLYGTMIIGANAYGVVDVGGGTKPEIIVKEHGSSGTADPLNQVASVGWKALMTVKVLQELAMVRIESAATL